MRLARAGVPLARLGGHGSADSRAAGGGWGLGLAGLETGLARAGWRRGWHRLKGGWRAERPGCRGLETRLPRVKTRLARGLKNPLDARCRSPPFFDRLY